MYVLKSKNEIPASEINALKIDYGCLTNFNSAAMTSLAKTIPSADHTFIRKNVTTNPRNSFEAPRAPIPLVRTMSSSLDNPIRSFHQRRASGMIQLDPNLMENPRTQSNGLHLSPVKPQCRRTSFHEMSVITSENEIDEDEVVQFEEDGIELYDLEENIVE